jgi:hypothetical protein
MSKETWINSLLPYFDAVVQMLKRSSEAKTEDIAITAVTPAVDPVPVKPSDKTTDKPAKNRTENPAEKSTGSAHHRH